MPFIENTFGSPELQRITGLHDGLLRQLRHRKYLLGKGSGTSVHYTTSEATRALLFASLVQIGLPPRVSRGLIAVGDTGLGQDPVSTFLDWAQLQRGAIFDPEQIAGRKLPIGEGELGSYRGPSKRYWVIRSKKGKRVATLESNLNQYFRTKRDQDGSVAIVLDLKWLARHFAEAAGRSLWIAVK